jgi:hypothetical protein
MRKRKYRIGQIMAQDVASGDILIGMEYNQGGIRMDLARPVGTVLRTHEVGDRVHWTVRTGNNQTKVFPLEPVGSAELTYVHVPWGQL